MENKMTVLVVEPDKLPYVKEIDPGLQSLQFEVEGWIQAVYPFDDPVALICNEEAISKLSEDKRDIILLSYFLDMSDGEISRKMNVLRRTICKRRLKSLSELQDYLLKEGYDWSDV